jgi:heterodisulfide reductase subunit A-like polyferredoxin
MIYEKEKRYIIPFDDVPSPRAKMPEISVDERKGNFTEVETGFPEEMAVQEARRCLSCRRCLGCALCLAECKPEAIDFNIPDQQLELEFDEVIITKGQENAFYPLNPRLGYRKYPDVITDLQFERMLSPTGPLNGLVVSPLDGEIPGRIAIVQGYTRDDDETHLLSSLILGVNQSGIALYKTTDLEVVLISPLCKSFQEQFFSHAEKIPRLQIIEGLPELVEKDSDIREPLLLHYSENGEQKQQTFDLIVILTKSKFSPEQESLGKSLLVQWDQIISMV